MNAPELRDYQRLAVEHISRTIVRGDRRLYVELPTGTGKTRVLGEVARQARRAGRVLAIAHTRELVRQLADGLSAGTGETAGVVMGKDDESGAAVVVGSVQTLRGRRLEDVLEAGPIALLALDECHHATPGNAYGRMVERVLDRYPRAVALGVTATPYRADRQRMTDVLPACAFARSMPDMAEAGWLAPLVWHRVEIDGLDLKGVRAGSVGGDADYRVDDLARVMGKPGIAGATAEATAPLLGERRTVVFGADVAHARALADAYRAQGLSAEAVYGDMPNDERANVLADWRDGHVQIVTNVAVLSEGFDLPALSACVNAAPTMSPGRFVQRIGRVTRTFPGKADALVIDVTGGVHGPDSLDVRQITLPVLLGRSGEDEDGLEQAAARGARRLLDPLGQAPTAWGRDPETGTWFAPAGNGLGAALLPDTAAGLVLPVLVRTKRRDGPAVEYLTQRLVPLRGAVGVVSMAMARGGRLHVFADKRARWRSAPATVAQHDLLRRLDAQAEVRAHAEGWNGGSVGLAITEALVMQVLRRERALLRTPDGYTPRVLKPKSPRGSDAR